MRELGTSRDIENEKKMRSGRSVIILFLFLFRENAAIQNHNESMTNDPEGKARAKRRCTERHEATGFTEEAAQEEVDIAHKLATLVGWVGEKLVALIPPPPTPNATSTHHANPTSGKSDATMRDSTVDSVPPIIKGKDHHMRLPINPRLRKHQRKASVGSKGAPPPPRSFSEVQGSSQQGASSW